MYGIFSIIIRGDVEFIGFELKVGDQFCNFVALYRSPNGTQDEFEKFSDNLKVSKNPFLVVSIGSFDAQLKSWYFDDITISQGTVLENITSQIIKEPALILDKFSSYIDLIFISLPII